LRRRASSYTERSSKALSPLSHTRSQEAGFRRPTVPVHAARRDGEDGETAQTFGSRRQWWLCCVSLETGAASLI
jgi:hypothetical protein